MNITYMTNLKIKAEHNFIYFIFIINKVEHSSRASKFI